MYVRGAAGLVIVVALAGCSSGSPKQNQPTSPAQSAVQTPSSATKAPATAAAAPDVQGQLLALSDLPTGWSIDHSSSGSGSDNGNEPACYKALSFKSQEKARSEADFVDGTNGFPALEETVVYMPGLASQAFDTAMNALNACGKVSIKDNGQTLTGEMGAMSFPSLGDESAAFQINLSTATQGLNLSVGIDLFVVRVGDEVASLVYDDLGTPDVDAFQQFAQNATSKLHA